MRVNIRVLSWPIGKLSLPIMALLLFPLISSAQAPTAEAILGQVLSTHGGSALGQVANAVITGQLTIGRTQQTYPVTIKIDVRQKLIRTEYRDAQGDVVFIKNGSMVWEVRGTNVKEFRNRHPFLQEVNLFPSLGVLQTLNPQASGFSHSGLVVMRGRQAHRLNKPYYPFAQRRENHSGSRENLDLYVDPMTYRIHQVDHTLGSDYNRLSFRYDNYQTLNDIPFPLLITHLVNNTKQWEISVASIAVNQPIATSQFVRP